jgi:hypothetical protein
VSLWRQLRAVIKVGPLFYTVKAQNVGDRITVNQHHGLLVEDADLTPRVVCHQCHNLWPCRDYTKAKFAIDMRNDFFHQALREVS